MKGQHNYNLQKDMFSRLYLKVWRGGKRCCALHISHAGHNLATDYITESLFKKIDLFLKSVYPIGFRPIDIYQSSFPENDKTIVSPCNRVDAFVMLQQNKEHINVVKFTPKYDQVGIA